jgi:hypothetical protein
MRFHDAAIPSSGKNNQRPSETKGDVSGRDCAQNGRKYCAEKVPLVMMTKNEISAKVRDWCLMRVGDNPAPRLRHHRGPDVSGVYMIQRSTSTPFVQNETGEVDDGAIELLVETCEADKTLAKPAGKLMRSPPQ